MRSHYKKLGPYIREIDTRNSEEKRDNLLGVSTQKVFIKSIANTVGTDFRKYKIVKRKQFTYVPDTSRRGDKIGLAMLDSHDEGLVSQAYTVFEVIDHNSLDPEYLMMWFRRPEFDRYARFKSHGSVRELFDWDEMCDVELPIPAIEKQREIVREYNTIVERIKLNEQLSQKLEETAQALYKQWFVDFEFPISKEYAESIGQPRLEGKPYKSTNGKMYFCPELEINLPINWQPRSLSQIASIKGGKRLPKGSSLTGEKNDHPYIKVADLGKSKFVALNHNFEYVPEVTQQKIARYIVSTGDLVLSIVGTIGIVKVIAESLNKANLTENCVKITNFTSLSADYVYHFFKTMTGKQEVEKRTVGGVQGKLPIYNIEAIKIIIPTGDIWKHFHTKVSFINEHINHVTHESTKLETLKNLLLAEISVYKE